MGYLSHLRCMIVDDMTTSRMLIRSALEELGVTQIAMAVPLYLLYEASVWIAWYWERQEKKKRETEVALATKEPN